YVHFRIFFAFTDLMSACDGFSNAFHSSGTTIEGTSATTDRLSLAHCVPQSSEIFPAGSASHPTCDEASKTSRERQREAGMRISTRYRFSGSISPAPKCTMVSRHTSARDDE